MSNETSTAIHAFISGRFPQHQFSESDDIFQLGFVNSLFAMELVMFVEKQFSVTIPNELLRIDNFRSVAAMADLVDNKLAALR